MLQAILLVAAPPLHEALAWGSYALTNRSSGDLGDPRSQSPEIVSLACCGRTRQGSLPCRWVPKSNLNSCIQISPSTRLYRCMNVACYVACWIDHVVMAAQKLMLVMSCVEDGNFKDTHTQGRAGMKLLKEL